MEMDMQGPGEMCYCYGEEHNLALTERRLNMNKIDGLHVHVSHIILSCLSTQQSS